MDNNKQPPALSLYSSLPEYIKSGPGLEGQPKPTLDPATQTFTPKYVSEAIVSGYDKGKTYNTKVHNKVLLLDNPVKDKELKATNKSKKQQQKKFQSTSKPLTSREKRQLNVYEIPIQARQYDFFLPLHQLWKNYIEELFGTTSPVVFLQKLPKADFHGAILTVVQSKCPTYIGLSGIVAQETENVFKIITVKNSMRVVPKVNSVFTINIRTSVFTLHGNQFRYRASQRSVKKFKTRPTIDL